MTHDKAREFFSAYHEGTLEPGLRISFEQKLNTDSTLREEYTRFTATIDQLATVRDIAIEVPFDLNEQIAARLDRHLWEKKQAAPVAWYARLRNIAFAGLATAALVGAVLTYNHSNSGSSRADLMPIGGSPSDQLVVSVKNDALTLDFAPSTRSTVIIRTEPGDQPFANISVDKGASLSRPLRNPNVVTDLISVEVSDTVPAEHVIIAIPGTGTEKVGSGSGTLEDFAKALAGKYRVPVTLNSGVDPLSQVTWDLSASDARQAAEVALKGLQLSVDQREGNLITISRG